MGTVSKALKLLDYFSNDLPEIGLTQFTRLTGHNKATVLGLLTELVEMGFLEQDMERKTYRLGPAVLRLANVREQTFPAQEAARPILAALCETTTETVHLSMLEGDTLSTIAQQETLKHGTRVMIDPAVRLPLHATASGKAVMAFQQPGALEEWLETPFESFTSETVTDAEVLRSEVSEASQTGFGRSRDGFEKEVYGIAAPIFDAKGIAIGAVAVATPTSRLDAELIDIIEVALRKASQQLTKEWGGITPAALLEEWKNV
jgi:DNA-binding IclR family transcriptional regulator